MLGWGWEWETPIWSSQPKEVKVKYSRYWRARQTGRKGILSLPWRVWEALGRQAPFSSELPSPTSFPAAEL